MKKKICKAVSAVAGMAVISFAATSKGRRGLRIGSYLSELKLELQAVKVRLYDSS